MESKCDGQKNKKKKLSIVIFFLRIIVFFKGRSMNGPSQITFNARYYNFF